MSSGGRSVRLFVALLVATALGAPVSAQLGISPEPIAPTSTTDLFGWPPAWLQKLEPILQQRISVFSGRSLVIVRAANASSLGLVQQLIRQTGGTLGRPLAIIDGQAANVPNWSLPLLALSSLVQHISLDRLIIGSMERTGATVGATAVRQETG